MLRCCINFDPCILDAFFLKGAAGSHSAAHWVNIQVSITTLYSIPTQPTGFNAGGTHNTVVGDLAAFGKNIVFTKKGRLDLLLAVMQRH